MEIGNSKQAISSQTSVSIVIPSYNSKMYLRQCLDSILGQSLRDIEVICVDAGSTDGSLEILNKYREMHENFRMIHSDKKSMGYQYNLGIKASQGEYVGFVETDDFIDEDMYQYLYSAAKSDDADIVRTNWFVFKNTRDSLVRVVKDPTVYGEIQNKLSYSTFVNEGDIGHWSGIYRRLYLIDNHIFYNETPGASYQDLGFYFMAYASGGRILFLNRAFYHYRNDNAEASIWDSRKVFCVFDEFKFVYENLKKSGMLSCYGSALAALFYSKYLWAFRRTSQEQQMQFMLRFSRDFKSLYDAGFCTEAAFSKNDLIVLNGIVFSPEQYLYDHRKAQKEFIAELSEIPNLIMVGKGMVANWILREMKDTSNVVANITSAELEVYKKYKEKGMVLIAVKKPSAQEEILQIVQQSGFRNYQTVAYGLFDF